MFLIKTSERELIYDKQAHFGVIPYYITTALQFKMLTGTSSARSGEREIEEERLREREGERE